MLDAARNLPWRRWGKPELLLAAASLLVAGCGGGGQEKPLQTVTGRGFSFDAPGDWSAATRARSSSAAPAGGGPEQVSVTVFRLARVYRPALWATVVPELDRVAERLAAELGGTVEARATVVVDGRRARRYDIEYRREGTALHERTAFVLDGRREYQLVCRYQAGEPPAACATLFDTFRLL